MIDPGKRQVAGTRPKLSAGAWNSFIAMSNEFQMQQTGDPSANPPVVEVNPSLTVMVLNSTGVAREPGHIVAMPKSTTALGRFPDDMLDAGRRPYLTGSTPAAGGGVPIAVYVDAVDVDEAGKAVILGVASTIVNMTDAAHNFAKPTPSDCTKFTSDPGGPYPILKVETGTGNKKAQVLIGLPLKMLEVVTDVQCDGGELDVTYTEIWTLYEEES